MKIILHLIITLILTILTQFGGIIYLTVVIFISKRKKNQSLKILFSFSALYIINTFFIIPRVAPIFGRTIIRESKNLKAHNFLTKLFNRNYVTLEMNEALQEISQKLEKKIPSANLIYLDANFPFFDGFPLLPHVSHNDGKKIDISFIYENADKSISNLKVSNSGYGVFENPNSLEANQTDICRQKGYWQYDFTKYLTFGSINSELQFSNASNKKLINLIVNNKSVNKLFIEPHIKKRLNLKSSKVRFHGCKAVRHDDHIHFQIK